jgi:hypothetical protein
MKEEEKMKDKNIKKEPINETSSKQSLLKHWFTGNGLFHNIDGSVSDRLVWIMIIIVVSLTVIFLWAFGKHPKPEYAFKLLTQYISIVLPLLIGGQTAENYFRGKRHGDEKDKL